MKSLALIAMIVGATACKHDAPPTTPGGGSDDVPAKPVVKQTPYEARREAACNTLGPKMTACALEDAKKDLAAKRVSQPDFDEQTKPEILKLNTKKTIEECERVSTTYQLRVLEVCQQNETECDPLIACLGHMNDPQPAPAAK